MGPIVNNLVPAIHNGHFKENLRPLDEILELLENLGLEEKSSRIQR
jgi:hypothetical protein